MSRDSEPRGRQAVIVTGAGSGIGRGVALRLAQDGFACVVAGPVTPQLEQTRTLAGAHRELITIATCDVRREDDRDRLVEAIPPGTTLYGLVNNAGVGFGAPLLDETPSQWQTTLDVNLAAAFFLSQRAVEVMREQGRGRVVNICSIRGFRAMNNDDYGSRSPGETPGNRGPHRMTAYAASKAASLQMTRDLAAAVGRWGITVNAVSPGLVQHPTYDKGELNLTRTSLNLDGATAALGDQLAPDVVDALIPRIPLGRIGDVDDVAGPVSFLLSDDAAYVTGANLVVDGGWTVW